MMSNERGRVEELGRRAPTCAAALGNPPLVKLARGGPSGGRFRCVDTQGLPDGAGPARSGGH